ncbi:MAG: hypothetical protein GAK30_01579 [Paracidovorax wautersii]|uniref:Phage-related baseplate assembly protein n=1 Tax=Paracidovorax wautersii TaxID=1177982 RepID=A0A7V8FPR9_9BURK|nr:MAG: hypothetical protein GAK30_01579 [Paracidovorax wautersii]
MIDLSQIPAPNIIESLDYETLLATRKAELIAAMPTDQQATITATLALESEPLAKWLQVAVYRELLLRQRVNDAARAVMLAQAQGSDIDQLAINYGYNVTRLVITPADSTAVPPVEAVMESDDDFRERILLSLDSYTTAGSTASYIYHAKSASGQVLDVSATSPEPGYVTVYILSRTGDGTASEDLLETVRAALAEDTVRPLTDHVTVLSGSIVGYTIQATIYVDKGSDPAVVQTDALDAAQTYADSVHRLDADPSISGIYRALHQPGVLRATLVEPTADMDLSPGQAAYCTAINITAEVAA